MTIDAVDALFELEALVAELEGLCTRLEVEGWLVRLSPILSAILETPDELPCRSVVYYARDWVYGGGLRLLDQLEDAAARGDSELVLELERRFVDATQGIAKAVLDVAKDLGETVTVSAQLQRFWTEAVKRTGQDLFDAARDPPWWLWLAGGVVVLGGAAAVVLAVRR